MLARFGDRPSHGLELNSLLRLDSFSERMFDLLHLRHEIRSIHQLSRRSSAGDNHMLHRGTTVKNGHDSGETDVLMLQRDIEFIKNHHRIRGIPQKPTSCRPSI